MSEGFRIRRAPLEGSEQQKALTRLQRLKVSRVMNDDPFRYNDFDDIWYSVWDECDLFYSKVASGGIAEYNDFIGDHQRLTVSSFQSAVKWLADTVKLTDEKPYCLLRRVMWRGL